MWKLDYFLVVLQTVLDFCFTGLYTLFYSFFMGFLYLDRFCTSGREFRSFYDSLSAYYSEIPDTPE